MRRSLFFLLSVAVVGFAISSASSSFIFPYVIDSNPVSSSLRQDTAETVDVTVKFKIVTSIETTYDETGQTALKFDINDETSYNQFYTDLSSLIGSSVSVGTSINDGQIWEVDNGKYVADIFSEIKKVKHTLIVTWYTYEGSGQILYYQKEQSIAYDESHDPMTFTIKKGSLISPTLIVSSLPSDISSDVYSFVEVLKEDGSSFDYETPVSNGLTLTAILRKNGYDGTDVSSPLGPKITSLTNGASANVYAGGQGGTFDLTKDPTYSSASKTVYLGNLSSPTYVAEGATVNFCLNDGNQLITNSSGNSSNSLDLDSSKTLQYKIVLQNDLHIRGTVNFYSMIGSISSSMLQSSIQQKYTALDLNGHDIFIYDTGSLNSYGLIMDSAGTGTIHVIGGIFQTLAVITDYRAGTYTYYAASADGKTFPFNSFTFPYLRCEVLVEKGNSWGIVNAFCNIVMSGSLSEGDMQVSNFALNFIGRENTDCFFEIQGSSDMDGFIRIKGTEIQEITDSSAIRSGLNWRLRIEFDNLDVVVKSFTFTLTVKILVEIPININTSDYCFPIPTYFDIYLASSKLRITQPIRFVPGSALIADQNSYIFLGYSGSRSASVSILDRGRAYFDEETASLIENDYVYSSSSFDAPFNSSDAYLKYFSKPRIKIYGTIVFVSGNSSVYRLAGPLDFAKIAYCDSKYQNIVEIPYDEATDPFKELNAKGVSVATYGFDYDIGWSDKGFVESLGSRSLNHSKCYARPLVSNGIAYCTDAQQSLVGKFSFENGRLDVGNDVYFFICDGIVNGSGSQYQFDVEDTRQCAVQKADSYNESGHYFLVGSKRYIYFASMYFSTDDSLSINVSRLTQNSDKSTMTVRFDSNSGRYVRA